ncbi:MAG: hypothetical protein ACREI9_11130, partial [Nitrospiraceae bacterium]
TLFGFLQSSPAPAPVAEAPPAAPPPAEAPPAEVPPSPPPAAPVEAAPAAPPQWQPWQAEPEEAPAPVAEAPPADVPAAEPQATDWKPWQPGDSTAPPAQQDEPVAASAAYAAAQPADKGGFFVVDSQTGRGGPAPSLGTAMPQIPTRGRAPAPPMPRRAVGRRAGGLGQVVRKLTTAAVGLAIATGLLLAALVIGCLVLEKSPTDAFRNFSGASPPSAQDPRRNAYVLLLGFDADAGRDPMAEGYERVQGPVSAKSIQCTWEGTASPMRFPSETAAVETWWLGPDPVGQFQKEAAKIQGWTAGSPVLMGRYRQWLGMEFEDGGYGKFAVPNCSLIVAAHRLHVAEGFGQGLARGIDGLERDLTLWRTALAQARTLPVKQLALAVVNDDLTLLTGVFSRPEITPDTVSRLAQLTKPLEQVERSLRWPMQNALTMDAKLFGTSALFDAVGDPSPLLQVLAHLPLPKQRALNAYADYYEALNKAADQPLTKLPLIYEFARTPAKTVFDYATNPLDNLVSSRTVIAWDQQVGAVMDTEARLRLVGVTAFLRGIPRKAIPVRIAQAGPRYTDPYTELPMLLNTSRGLIYSVGRNRKDDDGDSKLDVSVPWPMNEPPREAPKGRAR